MTTPIPALERAARAAAEANGEEFTAGDYLAIARAVLEAIREPDEAMVEAACAAHTPQWASVDRYIKLYARDMMRAALTAAFDALLHPK